MSKILVLDIETTPNQAFTWGLWQQNVSLNQLIEVSTVLCWSAKWLGEKKVHFMGTDKYTHKQMIKGIYDLINEAEAVITYNGKNFDMPTLMREFLLQGFKPPKPYIDIDLYRTVKNKFKFVSNKLDHVSQELGIGMKVEHMGMPLWVECMAGSKKAWRTMKKYNCQDVKLTEQVYYKLQGWVVSQFNFNTIKDSEQPVCPNCGSHKLQKRGFIRTSARQYQRYQCQGCGKWSKSTKSDKTQVDKHFVRGV